MSTEQAGGYPLQSFLAALLRATSDGRTKWISTSPTQFQLSTKSGTTMIYSRDGDGIAPFVLSVLDPNGVQIEALETDWEARVGVRVPKQQNVPLERLYQLARSQALNIDQVVNGILDDLGRSNDDVDPDDIPF